MVSHLGSPITPLSKYPHYTNLHRFVACMRAQENGVPDVTDRLKRRFVIFGLPLPTNQSARWLFGSILAGRFDSDSSQASELAGATLTVLSKVRDFLTPTLAKPHYQFSLHDVAKVRLNCIISARLFCRVLGD